MPLSEMVMMMKWCVGRHEKGILILICYRLSQCISQLLPFTAHQLCTGFHNKYLSNFGLHNTISNTGWLLAFITNFPTSTEGKKKKKKGSEWRRREDRTWGKKTSEREGLKVGLEWDKFEDTWWIQNSLGLEVECCASSIIPNHLSSKWLKVALLPQDCYKWWGGAYEK